MAPVWNLVWCDVCAVLVWCWFGVGVIASVVFVRCRRVACVGCVEC